MMKDEKKEATTFYNEIIDPHPYEFDPEAPDPLGDMATFKQYQASLNLTNKKSQYQITFTEQEEDEVTEDEKEEEDSDEEEYEEEEE